jgi:hypothetical protein
MTEPQPLQTEEARRLVPTEAKPSPAVAPDEAALTGVAKQLWLVVGGIAVIALLRWGWFAWDRYQASLAGFDVEVPAGPPPSPADWAEDDTPFYRAACPIGWELDKDFTGPTQWKCVAILPDLGQYPPNCNIIIEPKTAEALFNSSENYWTELRDEMTKTLPNMHILREEEVWFQGVKGTRAEFDHTSAGPTTLVFAYYLVGEKNAATLTCSSPPDIARVYRSTLESIASHIYIKDFEPGSSGSGDAKPQ